MTTNPKALYLSQLRDRTAGHAAFRNAAHQLTHLLAREAVAHRAPASPIALVPILRSGLAMLPAFLNYFPDASVGILGLQRNHTTGTIEQYYCNMPPLSEEHRVIILDPMIATGSTACAALDIITKLVPAEQILLVGIISATPGIDAIKQAHPGIQLSVIAQDEYLDNKNFIIPGLGDFGDRYFGVENT